MSHGHISYRRHLKLPLELLQSPFANEKPEVMVGLLCPESQSRPDRAGLQPTPCPQGTGGGKTPSSVSAAPGHRHTCLLRLWAPSSSPGWSLSLPAICLLSTESRLSQPGDKGTLPSTPPSCLLRTHTGRKSTAPTGSSCFSRLAPPLCPQNSTRRCGHLQESHVNPAGVSAVSSGKPPEDPLSSRLVRKLGKQTSLEGPSETP